MLLCLNLLHLKYVYRYSQQKLEMDQHSCNLKKNTSNIVGLSYRKLKTFILLGYTFLLYNISYDDPAERLQKTV